MRPGEWGPGVGCPRAPTEPRFTAAPGDAVGLPSRLPSVADVPSGPVDSTGLRVGCVGATSRGGAVPG